MLKRGQRRTHPSAITRLISSAVPTAAVLQHSSTKLWLTEQDEPFAIIELVDEGTHLHVEVSVHCSPQWAGIVVSLLVKLVEDVSVSPKPFIQDHKGCLRHGVEAENYWKWYRDARPLLTARFVAPDPY